MPQKYPFVDTKFHEMDYYERVFQLQKAKVGIFIAEYNNIKFFKIQKQISELWSYA